MSDIPEQYQETIRQFVIEYFNDRKWQVENNFMIMLPHEQYEHVYSNPLGTPFGQQLAEIARAASGQMTDDPEGWNRGVVYEGIQNLMEQLFAPPGLGAAYTIPAGFWETPLGQMVGLAWLWVDQDVTLTLAQAAEMAGVTIQAIHQAVKTGRLRGYIDASAPARQGRTLSRSKSGTGWIWTPGRGLT